MRRTFVFMAAAVVAAFVGTRPDAFAAAGSTDYVVTTPATGLYETPPSGAATVGIQGQYYGTSVTPPFKVVYWGVPYSSFYVTPTGYCCFGVSATQGAQSGQPSNGLMANVTPSHNWDGMCAPHWDNIYYGAVRTWTAGVAPNRRFIVSWEDFTYTVGNGEHLYFQARFFEATHKIQFAYRPDSSPSTWFQNRYNAGLVAPGSDSRWTSAAADSNVQAGHPPTDYEFSPRLVHCTGRVLQDRPIPTASGVPTTPTADLPLAGIRVELRHSDGTVLGSTTTAADGSYDVAGPFSAVLATGEVWLSSSSTACVVKDATGGPGTFRVATNVSLVNGADLGTTRLTAANDSGAAFRSRAAVARAIDRVAAWAATRTSAPIPPLAVEFDPASASATSYDSTNNGTLRVAGPAAANPDMWDEPVVMSVYARHVMASIAAGPSGGYDDRFDAVSDPENAFATAFGRYVWAAVTGERVFIDGVDAATATSYDLEDLAPATAKSASVAAWDAAVLYDLLDGANESFDWVDGAGAAGDLAFQTVDALTVAPTMDRFYKQWAQDRDARALSRVLIRHGVVADDAHEPNDAADEATSLAPTGGVRGASLQIQNEDWYERTFADAPADLVVEANWPSIASRPTVLVEVRDAADAVLASKTETSGAGPVAFDLGARAAGAYRARMRHVSGVPLPAYSIQIADRMTLEARPLKDWTEGRPYVEHVPLTGGVTPYAVSVQPAGSGIPGVGVNSSTLQLVGTPSLAGSYAFSLSAQDAGDPQHSATSTQFVVIHPPVALPMAAFVGVPADRPVAFALPRTGGTPPFASSLDAGAPPGGLSFDGTAFRVVGAATAPGSSKATFSTIDTAGSAASRDAMLVACPRLAGKSAPVDLAAGDSACGFYVDAVKGSALAFSFATPKGSAKRTLVAAVVGGDGLPVAGAKATGGAGRATGKCVAAASGRFFFIAGSADGAATHLVGAASSRPPAKGAGAATPLSPGGTFEVEVGALAGASLAFTAKPDPKSHLALAVIALIGPDGAAVPIDGLGAAKKGAATLAASLDRAGTWIVRVRATGSTAGSAKWSFKLKQPKGGSFSAD